MKLHLPISLLTVVLATIIALPAQAVEAPDGYTTTYLNSTSELGNYSTLTSGDSVAFILENSLEFTPTSNDYWTSSTPLVSGGNVFMGSYNSVSPVALSFKDGKDSVYGGQYELAFDTLSNLRVSSIEGNKAAISLANNGSLTIMNVADGQSGTVDVLFEDIKHTALSSLGGAIYGCTMSICYNGDVTFRENSSYSTSYDHTSSGGGAINAYGALTISYNNVATFSENTSISNSSYSIGGAIRAASSLAINHNGAVIFNDNSAVTNSSYSSAGGGAIYASSLTISNNSDVSFSDNSTASSASYYSSSGGGGAIYAENGLIISNNGDVTFNDNYSSDQGGAIYLEDGGVTISNNGDVRFSNNSASGGGGAIFANIGYPIRISIQGNDSVLFEKNYERNRGSSYLLRSIRSGRVNLSAKSGGNITFFDTVIFGDSYFNRDYVDADGNTKKADGDIIFSGKYAEQHLNEILAANNENRTATASEILNSQTSEIRGYMYVNGGSVQIVDGAVLKVGSDTVSIAAGSDATLTISDAELIAENANVVVGASATLQLSNGASVTADEINIAAGATLCLGDVATTTAVSDSMVAAYRLSSLNIINADLTFAAGSTLVTDGTGASMTDGSVLTFMATSKGEKINLVFTLGTEYGEEGLVQLFSNVDIVKFLMDGEEVDGSITLLASDFFTGDYINENTTLAYDSTSKTVYLQGVNNVVPEPTTATLSLLALAALAMRRRRK